MWGSWGRGWSWVIRTPAFGYLRANSKVGCCFVVSVKKEPEVMKIVLDRASTLDENTNAGAMS